MNYAVSGGSLYCGHVFYSIADVYWAKQQNGFVNICFVD